MFMRIIGSVLFCFDPVWLNQCTSSKKKKKKLCFQQVERFLFYSCYWKSCIFDDSKNAVNGNALRTNRSF